MPLPFEALSIEQAARFPRPGAVIPGSIQFTPDSKEVFYLLSSEGSLVRSLWSHDIASGRRWVVVEPPGKAASEANLSHEEQLRRERARLRETGVTDYRFAREAPTRTFIVPVAGNVLLHQHGDLREIKGAEGAIDPLLSPNGARLAFVRDGELHVIDLPGGEPRQLTTGAEPGLTHGLAGFIDQEELDRSRGYWWSPDGTRIAFQRNDERHIAVYPIVHQGTAEPQVEEHRYPFPGHANAHVGLGVIDVVSGALNWLDLGPEQDIYLARVAWTHDGHVAAQVLSRDQTRSRWLRFAAHGGKPTVLFEDEQQPWINLDHDTRFLETGEILRTSERDGFRHLSLHDAEGDLLRQLTGGDWVVTHLVEVDEERRLAYFNATRDSVLERHLYRVSLNGGQVERLTDDPGWHGVVVAPDGSSFVDVHSTRTHAPTVTLRSMDGAVLATLFDNAGNSAEALGLTPPRLTTVPAADGTLLHAAVYEPVGAQGGKHPVVVSVYGGPHAQRIADEWSLTVDLRAQYLAQHGIAVVKIDNRGSANRGLTFEAHLAGQFGQVEVEDQVAGLRALARELPYLDLDRVGMYGWSYGGYMTIMSLLKEPSLFQVGVAGAPVTDWDGYDTAYTERYIGTPESNPDGYRASSVLPLASRLEGKLLIVHGMVDENVHFRHTARLMKRLSEEQRPFDTLIFPEERHMPRDAKGLEYQERVVLDYLVRHLSE